ncbi:MAG TPA: YkgJ family cysteine cluster protein [Xanthomonadaceae bacterium]|nr:YkgJ family cysteine cluster protein [Xanthomonadaceae bacterium]
MSDRHQALRREARERVQARAGEAMRRQEPDGARRIAIRLLDEELRRVPAADRGPLACAEGCTMCCHLRVMVTAAEVFGLIDYLESTLSAADFASFRQRVETVQEHIAGLPKEAVLTTNIACPVLVDGRCSGYAARPFNCRSYHSLDRDACQQAFDHPTDTSLGHPQYAAVARVHEGVQGGLIAALAEAGYDSAQRELVSALHEALNDADARTRFRNRGTAFLQPSPV